MGFEICAKDLIIPRHNAVHADNLTALHTRAGHGHGVNDVHGHLGGIGSIQVQQPHQAQTVFCVIRSPL